MSTNHYHSTFRLVKTCLVNLAVFGMGLSPLGATELISSLHDPSPASRLKTLPHEWSVKVWEGIGQVQVLEENQHKILRLETERGRISLFRALSVNLQASPLVSWEWKVLTLPTGAASRQVQRDDHGAALYLIFTSKEASVRTTTLGYIWDNTLPVGSVLARPDDPSVQYLVVRSGQDQLGAWLTEERNVLADYVRIFGEEPFSLQGISLVVDSDQTHSKATSLFGPINFSHESQLAKRSRDQKSDEPEALQQNKLLGALLMYLSLKHPGALH
ncbi:MAG: DUF3047 domain-containing protein [Nitrospirales bacterium]